ncbi:MAG: NTP transferase domain-containing protein [Desulfurococcales archaeon]|nr:NTP transferase domain-containing protein [Desulfurococcales archaeon]
MDVIGLVLAAGYGTRSLRSLGVEKQRLRIHGVPLVCYPLAALVSAGVTRLYIAASAQTRGYIAEYSRECGVDAELVLVPEPWRGNGYTLLYSLAAIASRGSLEWIIVAMSDHIVHPDMARIMVHALDDTRKHLYVVLADRRPRFVDYREATKLRLGPDGNILEAGKGLEHADAVDTGVHAVRPSLAGLLNKVYTVEIIDMVNLLARHGMSGAVTGVDGAPWIDVDGYEDLYSVECGHARIVPRISLDDSILPASLHSHEVECNGWG